jgi:hypothetical protein
VRAAANAQAESKRKAAGAQTLVLICFQSVLHEGLAAVKVFKATVDCVGGAAWRVHLGPADDFRART